MKNFIFIFFFLLSIIFFLLVPGKGTELLSASKQGFYQIDSKNTFSICENAFQDCDSFDPEFKDEALKSVFEKKLNILKLIPLTKKNIFFQTINNGSFLFNPEEQSINRLSNIPLNPILSTDKKKVYRNINGITVLKIFSQNSSKLFENENKIYFALNDEDLIISKNAGKNWSLLEATKKPGYRKYELGKRNIYLAIEAFYTKPDATENENSDTTNNLIYEQIKKKVRLFVATSYNGLYYSSNGGLSWTKQNKGLPNQAHSGRVAFYESILSIKYWHEKKIIFVGTAFGRGLYQAKVNTNGATHFKKIELPKFFSEKRCNIENINITNSSQLEISSDCEPYTLSQTGEIKNNLPNWKATKLWNSKDSTKFLSSYERFSLGKSSSVLPPVTFYINSDTNSFQAYYNYASFRRKNKNYKKSLYKQMSLAKAFYISPTTSRRKHYQVFKLIKSGKFNAVVIDFKTDGGRVPIEGETKLSKKYYAVYKNWTLAPLLKKLKEKKIYTIARIVTFKDPRLAKAEKSKYVLKDKYTGAFWKDAGGEIWVNAYLKKVWDYNIEIAKQAEKAGFDEIQFDYIRFPSDGSISRITFGKENKGYKSETLQAFLKLARHNLKTPISIDIYGYHSLYRIGNPIGQNMLLLGEYVDVVSPMLYSSHFGNKYMSQGPRKNRAYNLLYHSAWRANTLAKGRFIIRPWLQAFKMKVGLWGWGKKYFDDQVKGSVDGGSKGHLWWGPIKIFFQL